jgi:predicted RNase H-like HicB family nuclease
MNPYHIVAEWDDSARVWVATSDDVPGLVTEAESRDELVAHLRQLVPELLQLNSHLLTQPSGGHHEFVIHWAEDQRVMYA